MLRVCPVFKIWRWLPEPSHGFFWYRSGYGGWARVVFETGWPRRIPLLPGLFLWVY